MRLVSASEMQEIDRLTIRDMGIPGVVLMENAARGVTRIFLDHFNPRKKSHVVILCGRGNNGGDGYVIARYLHRAGLNVTVPILSALETITGDALINLDIIRRMKLKILEVPGSDEWDQLHQVIQGCDYIIDGILGTGLNSPVKGFFRQVIEEINKSHKPVTAIDIPSGLNADTGQVMGVAVKANLTVTFGFPKLGQLIFPGAGLVGSLAGVDIGIPDIVANRISSRYKMTEPNDFNHRFMAEKEDIHKGNRGHLLVLAGSTGKTGAAALTALAAIRAGAGLVTIGIPESLNSILETKLTEAMTAPLPETREGSISIEAKEKIFQLMDGKTALALGPGLSTNLDTISLIRDIVSGCRLPVVIDADGINALAGKLDVLINCKGRAVLTPHPGEMGRLTGMKSTDLQADRLGNSIEFVEQHGVCLVLKGAQTLITKPNGEIHVNPTGNRALSSGGSGDVLTGLIGGLLARGWPVSEAAIAGVYLHGLAADYLSEKMGRSGILAGELTAVLPELIASVTAGEWPLKNRAPHDNLHHLL